MSTRVLTAHSVKVPEVAQHDALWARVVVLEPSSLVLRDYVAMNVIGLLRRLLKIHAIFLQPVAQLVIRPRRRVLGTHVQDTRGLDPGPLRLQTWGVRDSGLGLGMRLGGLGTFLGGLGRLLGTLGRLLGALGRLLGAGALGRLLGAGALERVTLGQQPDQRFVQLCCGLSGLRASAGLLRVSTKIESMMKTSF